MNRSWLTVDFDEERHVPRAQGHPSRSKDGVTTVSGAVSPRYTTAMKGFEQWIKSNDYPITFFVIADQFQSDKFREWFASLLAQFGERITVGCHGLTHRCWSAWPEDPDGFAAALAEATSVLQHHCGSHFRPWFRAPAGYIAPWMAAVLSKQGYLLDSSVNPSLLVQRKAGKGNSWTAVSKAVEESGMVERVWKTRFGLPMNGPALSLFPLSILAFSAWKRAPAPFPTKLLDTALLDPATQVTTLYWHVLDHARKDGSWLPPLPQWSKPIPMN